MNTKTINIQVLALLGDAVLSLYIREKLLKQGINNANKLNASAVPYVSAKGQVKILDKLTKDNFLTEEELDIILSPSEMTRPGIAGDKLLKENLQKRA